MATVKDQRTALPQVVRTPDGFRVFTPELVATQADVTSRRGRLGVSVSDGVTWFTAACTAVGAAILAVLLGGPWWAVVGWVLLGGLAGMAVGGFLGGFVDRRDRYARAHGGQRPELDVIDDRGAAIVAVAVEIAGSDPWRRRIVDPDRQMGAAVWGAALAGQRAATLRAWLADADGDDRGVPGAQAEASSLDESRATTERNLRELHGIVLSLVTRPADGATVPESGGVSSNDVSEGMLAHGRVVRDLLGSG